MTTLSSRARLIQLLFERSFERRPVVLASGKTSDFFIDCKQTVLTAEGHALVGELMFEEIGKLEGCDAVAGVELGGCPLASAVSLISFQKGRPLPALYVRKVKKDHGMAKLVEGDKALFDGIRVVLLEDVVTTGASTLRAMESLRSFGAKIAGVVALVDRLDGGSEAIRAAGAPFVALATRHDFMN